jgi:hypothetical protein
LRVKKEGLEACGGMCVKWKAVVMFMSRVWRTGGRFDGAASGRLLEGGS